MLQTPQQLAPVLLAVAHLPISFSGIKHGGVYDYRIITLQHTVLWTFQTGNPGCFIFEVAPGPGASDVNCVFGNVFMVEVGEII